MEGADCSRQDQVRVTGAKTKPCEGNGRVCKALESLSPNKNASAKKLRRSTGRRNVSVNNATAATATPNLTKRTTLLRTKLRAPPSKLELLWQEDKELSGGAGKE